MARITTMLPANVPLIDQKGLMARPWYQYFNGQNRTANAAVAGEVQTDPGSGLQGGGFVAEGIDLSIAPSGVTRPMLAEGLGTSVIGRFQDSTGDVGDIKAIQNRTVLQRRDDELGFFPSLDVASVECDTLIVASDPPANAAATGVAGTITWDSGFIYVCVATDTWKRVAIATW